MHRLGKAQDSVLRDLSVRVTPPMSCFTYQNVPERQEYSQTQSPFASY